MIVPTAGDVRDEGTEQMSTGLIAVLLSGSWIYCVELGWFSGILFVLGIIAMVNGFILHTRALNAIYKFK